MKKPLETFRVVMILLACVLCSAQFAQPYPAFSNSEPFLDFSPSYTLVKDDVSFTVELSLTNCPAFSFFDLVVVYNASILEALNASISLQWAGFVSINDTAGTVELYSYSNTTYLSGNLTLGEIMFRSVAPGNSTLQFLMSKVGVPPDYYISLGIQEGSVEVVALNITIATTSRFYYPNQNITAFGNITVAGTQLDSLIGIEVRTPENESIAMRVVTSGYIPPDTPWKVNVTDFYPVDENGGRVDTFIAGLQARFRVTVQNLSNETLPICFAVNLYDSYGGTVGVATSKGIVAPNSETSWYSLIFVPSKTFNGTATAIAGVFSGRPSEGGHPYCIEKTTNVKILSTVTTYPQISASNETFHAGFNLTFRLPLTSMRVVSMGEFRVFAGAMYRGLDINATTRIAYVNLVVNAVDPNANYTTIQAAINAANNTNGIYVAQGIYNENVVINKPAMTIIGDYDNSTIVDGHAIDNAIHVTAPYARVINLHAVNSGAEADHNSGIKVSSINCDLRDNTVRNNVNGISIENSSLSVSEPTRIFENNVYSNTFGIFIGNASNYTRVFENKIHNNTCGISLDNTNYTSISINLVVNNTVGLQLASAAFSEIAENNLVSNNQGAVLEGLLSHNNTLRSNEILANQIGIKLHLAINNSVIDNNIANNAEFGVQILDADYNGIQGNDFIGNGVQAYSNATTSRFDNGYPAGGNYWSDYGGVDVFTGAYQNVTGSDGIGDAPYSFQRDSSDYFPFVKPSYWQDIGVTDLFSKTVFAWNYSSEISLRLVNYGTSLQISNVTLYCNDTVIGMQTITMEGRNFRAVIFNRWNGSGLALGNYSLIAQVTPYQLDMNMTNNQITLGIVLTIPGDVNGDFKVKPQDLNALLVAYGSPSNPEAPYNPNADIDDDGKIGPNDLNILLNHYGQPHP